MQFPKTPLFPDPQGTPLHKTGFRHWLMPVNGFQAPSKSPRLPKNGQCNDPRKPVHENGVKLHEIA
jgi:hypothetical protein